MSQERANSETDRRNKIQRKGSDKILMKKKSRNLRSNMIFLPP